MQLTSHHTPIFISKFALSSKTYQHFSLLESLMCLVSLANGIWQNHFLLHWSNLVENLKYVYCCQLRSLVSTEGLVMIFPWFLRCLVFWEDSHLTFSFSYEGSRNWKQNVWGGSRRVAKFLKESILIDFDFIWK